MSWENEHLYTNHKYNSFPFWRKETKPMGFSPLHLWCLWNATSVKNWLLDKWDVWIYGNIVIIWKWIDDNILGDWGITAHRYCILCKPRPIWLNMIFSFYFKRRLFDCNTQLIWRILSFVVFNLVKPRLLMYGDTYMFKLHIVYL